MIEVLLALLGLGVIGGAVVGGVRLFRTPRPAMRSMSGAPMRLSLESIERDARLALVAIDDNLADGRRELDFALAQFGSVATQDFAEALEAAEAAVQRAFVLQHELDDENPETEQRRRIMFQQISALAAKADAALQEHVDAFEVKRRAESRAPELLRELEARIAEAEAGIAKARPALERAEARFGAAALIDVHEHPDAADRELRRARHHAETATAGIDKAARSVTDELAEGGDRAWAALHLLEAVTHRIDDLEKAASALTELTAASGERARELLAKLPADPDQAATIRRAAEELQTTVGAVGKESAVPHDPVRMLDRLRLAGDGLEAAIHAARGQQQRLAGARSALGGALAAARSHIGVAQQLIDGNRGRVGGEARSRLAEAERQLGLAEAESDPVIALDTARRAGTLAQDADALARYALL